MKILVYHCLTVQKSRLTSKYIITFLKDGHVEITDYENYSDIEERLSVNDIYLSQEFSRFL